MAAHLLDRGARVRARTDRRGPIGLVLHLDLLLIGSALALAGLGVVMVYSATRSVDPFEPTYYLKRQLVYAALGVVVLLLTTFVDYRRLTEWGYLIYGLVVVSLLAVLVVGKHVTAASSGVQNAQRWIPIGPFELQPSEFGVLAIVIVLAVYLGAHGDDLTPKRLLTAVLLALVPMLLVYKQPDLGTTIIMVVVLFSVLTIAGSPVRYLLVGIVLAALAFVVALQIGLIHGYQLARLTDFLNPNSPAATSNANAGSVYSLNLAETAIGAGGLRGTGLFNGAVTSLNYVPEAYADSIFSAVGEQLGFLGSVVMLGLFGVIAARIFRGIQLAGDLAGRIICGGALAFLVFSVFQNVGMWIGLMPITGIPLPFVSYGGSALLAFFAAIGLVANVELRRRSFR